MVFNKYGFVADPNLTTLHNAANMMSQMPFWYYMSKPTNLSCQNLCTNTQPPANFCALLGLGLKYIPKPRYTNSNIVTATERFRHDLYTKIFLAHTQSEIPRLFIRSDWTPPIRMVNYNLQLRVNNLIKQATNLFIKKATKSNMLPYQRRMLADFRNNKTHIVFNADKNLGPCIIERAQYIKRALNDHLLDKATYQQLTIFQAKTHIDNLTNKLNEFISYYKHKLSHTDIKFLQKSLETTKDPYAKFYITAKVHKSPWKTRPIVSVCGSLLDGLGRLVDKILQPFSKNTTSAIKNSLDLKEMLVNLNPLPASARFFTADAVSMYTNIDTTHALAVIQQYIKQQPSIYATIHEQNAAIEGLTLIMKNNIFQFGDTYWLQLNGTAMGVSPSCAYATLYFAVHEQKLLKYFPELSFYKRFIDDIIGIWIPKSTNDDARWLLFQKEINCFGLLKWEFSKRATKINFLDLTLQLHIHGKITTKIFEKAENLYLYLPATSCHPFNNLKGLIHGMVYRTIRLTSSKDDQAIELQNLVRRLTARGYQQSFLTDIINKTYHQIQHKYELAKTQTEDDQKPDKGLNFDEVCFFHTFYHPNNPTSSQLQQLFQEAMMKPKGMYKLLPDLLNHRKAKLCVNRMIIAYHRTPNLGNLLSPRVLKREDGPRVSSYID